MYREEKYKRKGLCEASKGIDDSRCSPMILLCRNKAECVIYLHTSTIGYLLCNECRDKLKQKYDHPSNSIS